MKLEGLKKLIKEELAKAINEAKPKYEKDEIIYFQGTPHIVLSDEGSYIIKTKIKGTGIIKNIPRNRIDPDPVKENQPMVEPAIKEPAIKEPERKKRRSLSPPEESPNTKPKALTVKEDEAKLVAKIAQRFKKLEK
jgi:hypothetical protein